MYSITCLVSLVAIVPTVSIAGRHLDRQTNRVRKTKFISGICPKLLKLSLKFSLATGLPKYFQRTKVVRFQKGTEETLRSETLAIKMKLGENAAFWSAVSLAIFTDTRAANSFLKTWKLPTRECMLPSNGSKFVF